MYLNQDVVTAAERIVEKFGFPIFISLCALVLFWAVWRYFSKGLSTSNERFMSYIQARDDKMGEMVKSFNDAFNKNTIAFIELKLAVTQRIKIEERQLSALEVKDEADR